MNPPIYAGIASLVITLATLAVLVSPRLQHLAVDIPNARSLHKRPTPRTGGLAILAGTTAGAWLAWDDSTLAIWVLALLLGGVSFLDDRWGLPIGLRLAVQFIVAGAVIALVDAQLPPWWFVVAAVAIVWMINLYNFMDGADGLAGGMGVSGFGAYALASLGQGNGAIATLSACLVCSCVGFLRYNLPPARIFMGDAGSTVLGFCAAAIGLCGERLGLWPLWFPLLAFLPFIGDATVTICKRAGRREKIWRPHREHYYQRVVLSGWSHKQLAGAAYVLMMSICASSVLSLQIEPELGWFTLAAWIAVLAVLMLIVEGRSVRNGRAAGR
jgi:UDP-GlcNAc:undecaprenyl-phosphate/decaprenyl-phosphate GlcNAc-1-phosphate transferase